MEPKTSGKATTAEQWLNEALYHMNAHQRTDDGAERRECLRSAAFSFDKALKRAFLVEQDKFDDHNFTTAVMIHQRNLNNYLMRKI